MGEPSGDSPQAADVTPVKPQVKDPHFRRNWWGFFIIGTINNLGYVMVNSAAQRICSIDFDESSFISLILWFNVAIGFILRSINAFCLTRVPFKWRMVANAAMMLFGLIGLAFSKFIGFWFALVSVLFVGGASNFGESVLLGYQKKYSAETVGGWSSGTGMAGVAGAALYLAFVAAGLSNMVIFLIIAPTTFIYMACYGWMLVEPDTAALAPAPADDEVGGAAEKAVPKEHEPSVNAAEQDGLLAKDAQKESSMARLCRVLLSVLRLSIQLLLVYFFEYVASVGAADLAVTEADKKCSPRWEVRNSYIVMSFCYQVGVFMSRSSLKLLKIRWVEILTTLQAVNFVLFLLQDHFKFMDVWVMFPIMVYVGLLGGASYVNTFYLILNGKASREDKDLGVNLTALHITVGITVASVFSLVMKITFLKPIPFGGVCP